MTNESRAAFESWLIRECSPLQPGCTRRDKQGNYVLSWSQTNWEAWQASRKVAMESAVAIVENTREYTRFDAVQAIKELLK